MSRLLPRYIQLSSLLLAGLVALLAIWLPLAEPWLGVRFAVADGQVVVAAVAAEAAELRPAPPLGARVSGIGRPGAAPITLRPESFIDTPGYFSRFTDYNTFFGEQKALTALRQAPEVVLHLADGEQFRLPWRERGVRTLNLVFWFQLGCALLAFSVAASVLAFRPRDSAARLYFLLGLASLLIGATAAVMRARMLSIDADGFRAVHVINHIGIFLGCAAQVGFLASYPRRCISPRGLAAVFAFYGLVLAVDIGQWIESINLAFRTPLLATALPCVGLLIWQWRASRRHPLDRAALRWILFAFGVSMALIFANVLRTALGAGTLLPSGYNTALTLLMFIGMAIGIRRSALFNLDPWWLEAWIWLLGGLAVVVVDLLLMMVLRVGEEFALATALLVCGWLYFPARQAVLARVYGRQKSVSDVFPEVVDMLLARSGEVQEFGERWQALLRRLFAPQAMTRLASPGGDATVRVQDDGLRLRVPALDGDGDAGALLLEYANGGSRLFTHRDAALAQSIRDVVARGLSAQAQFAEGAQAERERIAHDLHDDIGARLLTLIHRARAPEDAYVARAAMQDLRTLLSALDERPRPLDEVLADWRAEAASRCEAAGLALHWTQQIDGPPPALSARQRVNLEKLLRELLTNVIRHARASSVRITVALRDDGLAIDVADDGIGLAEDRWRSGRGTQGMERRARDIGARIERDAGAEHGGPGTRMKIFLPLTESP